MWVHFVSVKPVFIFRPRKLICVEGRKSPSVMEIFHSVIEFLYNSVICILFKKQRREVEQESIFNKDHMVK